MDRKIKYEQGCLPIERYDNDQPIHFLKWSTQYNILDGKKIQIDNPEFQERFPFVKLYLEKMKKDKQWLKTKNTEFAFQWFKKFGVDGFTRTYSLNKKRVEQLSHLNDPPKVDELQPYSFVLRARVRLSAPYFSRDDDEFYLVHNPCLKDTAFKVPMVRPSAWKGAVAAAAKRDIDQTLTNGDARQKVQAYLRVFGTGSEAFRLLLDSIRAYLGGKAVNGERVRDFLRFELGLRLKKDEIDNIKKNPEKWLEEKFAKELVKDKMLPEFLNVHKGRTVFYPTFFDRLTLEVINPHSRPRRAGTGPVFYEVVPPKTEGILQVVYIPHDGLLESKERLKREVAGDLKLLADWIEGAGEGGIGAKKGLGWGRFELEDKKCLLNQSVDGLGNLSWELKDGTES